MESNPQHAPLRKKETPRFTTPVRVVCTHYRKRFVDPDNLSIKAVLDALTRANILTDDSSQQITEITHRQVKARNGKERTVLRIEEC